jgi:hypothetical protein
MGDAALLDPDDSVPPHILDAIAAARAALADLRLNERILAIESLQYLLELEIATWERAQDPTTH